MVEGEFADIQKEGEDSCDGGCEVGFADCGTIWYVALSTRGLLTAGGGGGGGGATGLSITGCSVVEAARVRVGRGAGEEGVGWGVGDGVETGSGDEVGLIGTNERAAEGATLADGAVESTPRSGGMTGSGIAFTEV